MSDCYQHGCVIDINNYGTKSVAFIDGEERDIIMLTYNILIKKDNGEIISLKSNSYEELEKGDEIHFLYNNDNYITCIIDEPDEMWDELEKSKEYLKNKKSFFKTAKNYVKSTSLFMVVPSFFIILIDSLFSEQQYEISTLFSAFVIYWIFFTSLVSIILSIIEHPLNYFTYSDSKIKTSYYKSFIEGYNRNISQLQKNTEMINEYIQEK